MAQSYTAQCTSKYAPDQDHDQELAPDVEGMRKYFGLVEKGRQWKDYRRRMRRPMQ